MQKDERDLLEVLKFELKFLEDGGYGRSPKASWRALYIFEDSLTCMNCDSKYNPAPCSDCVLMQLVPPKHRSEKIPCRHIPFNESGDTLDSLYRYSSQIEIEETTKDWLRSTIHFLEEQRETAARSAKKQEPRPPANLRGTPLYQKHHPKCANPACPTAFHWTGGGKFFRFRPDPASTGENDSTDHAPTGIHGVRHYWLCERCSHVFTLVYDKECGVTLKLIWPELVPGEAHKEFSTAELRGRCKMQEDERDLLEVLIFDEIEETVGTWLRTIIQRLQKEQNAVRRHHLSGQPQAAKTLRRTLAGSPRPEP